MQRKIDLIYCGIGNEKLDSFAVQVGMHYGARLPIKRQLPFQIHFADQDWKNPSLDEYKKEIKEKKPNVCTVLDWERPEQEVEVYRWIEEISPLVNKIIVIPKVSGTIDSIAKEYNGKEIILGYSVPTRYGATLIPIQEFKDRRVHLLGGSPRKQLALYDEMDVVSVDCNYISMKATKFCEFWTNKKGYTREWIAMKDVLGARLNDNLYTAFFLSCVNYVEAWNNKVGGIYYDI